MNFKSFINHLQQYLVLDTIEIDFIKKKLELQSFQKGEFLLQEGQVSKAFYFNTKGCVRLFYNVNGQEKTAFFYPQNQFISAYKSFVRQQPSAHYLQAMEETKVVVISRDSAYQLLDFSPKFEALSRIMMEEELMTYQDIIASFITQSPEQRYLLFIQHHPQLLQRIPQHYIASYLGVSPESLSRIKRRIAQKNKNLT